MPRARAAARNISAEPSARPVWASSPFATAGIAMRRCAGSVLRQLVVVRQYGAVHRIRGVHHVGASHGERRDIIRNGIHVLRVAGSLGRPDKAATRGGSERGHKKAEAYRSHQSLRSGKEFIRYYE